MTFLLSKAQPQNALVNLPPPPQKKIFTDKTQKDFKLRSTTEQMPFLLKNFTTWLRPLQELNEQIEEENMKVKLKDLKKSMAAEGQLSFFVRF
jgi:hypothetical protein